METQTTDIQLVQKPVIQHRIEEIGASVTKRLEELNIDSLVATEDTMQALKTLRADLNKELKGFEEQRKVVKQAVADPYLKFEEIYKSEISEKYTEAITKLKDKIEDVETKIKDEKKVKVRSFFGELCVAEGVDFLKWESLNIEINLSTTVKKYQEQVSEFIAKVKDDLALIDTNEYKAEILVEYKNTLNVAAAITSVQERKKREEEEKERIRQAKFRNRTTTIQRMGMTYVDMTDSYEFGENIIVSSQEIRDLDDKQWMEKFISLEQQINDVKVEVWGPVQSELPMQSAAPIAAPVTRPIAAPTEKGGPGERIVTATFEVKGAYSALRALGQYMRDNNIEYKNI